MSNIQNQYKKRKRISIFLLLLLYCFLIALGIIAPEGEHPASSLELALFGGVILTIIAVYVALRCPNCGAFLAAGSSWGFPKFCSKCGQKLIE